MSGTNWRSYEEVAQHLLSQFAAFLNLDAAEGKQKVTGVRSGRRIEIDGRGVRLSNMGVIVVECKHYPNDKVGTADLEALAYRIMDVGAVGGIIVTPIGLQAGALLIAQAENITTVKLEDGSTELAFLMRFLNQIMVGVHDHLEFKDSFTVEVAKAPATQLDEAPPCCN
jgi:hypothetical protein